MFERALPPPLKKVAVRLPVEYRPVRVPTCVMLGWRGCETTRATFALATFPTSTELWMFERALPPPAKNVAVRLPVEYRPVKVPTCVILGWRG